VYQQTQCDRQKIRRSTEEKMVRTTAVRTEEACRSDAMFK